MRTVSVGMMIEQLEGLMDTKDLSDWEQDFVSDIGKYYRAAGRRTSMLSPGRVEKVEEIWKRHFA